MNTLAPAIDPLNVVQTTYGVVGTSIRVIRVRANAVLTKPKRKFRTLAEANAWLAKNAARADAHARASTKRLIGRETV